MSTPAYDEDIMSQLLAFGYSRQDIINASQKVLNHRDINIVQQQIDADSNSKTLSSTEKQNKTPLTSNTNKHTKYNSTKTPTKRTITANSWIKTVNNDKHDPSLSGKDARKASILALQKRGALSQGDPDAFKRTRTSHAQLTPNPLTFSPISSIQKLKQIASVSKLKQQSQKATLIDAVVADDESYYKWFLDNNLQMPGSHRRRGALQKHKKSSDSWIRRKQTINNTAPFIQRDHIQNELSLLFDFRDFEKKSNITKQFQRNIKKRLSDKASEAMELMRKKTFNHVRLKHDTKQKAISGFEKRLLKQKQLREAGFCAVPLLHDEDFDNDTNKRKLSRLSRRDLLQHAMKDEQMAMDHCVMIVEELGFLKYMKDNAEYMQLLKSRENAMQIAREKKHNSAEVWCRDIDVSTQDKEQTSTLMIVDAIRKQKVNRNIVIVIAKRNEEVNIDKTRTNEVIKERVSTDEIKEEIIPKHVHTMKGELDQSVIMNKTIVGIKGRRKRTKKKIIVTDDEEPKMNVSMSLFSTNTVQDEDIKKDETADDDMTTGELSAISTSEMDSEYKYNIDFDITRSRSVVVNGNIPKDEQLNTRSRSTVTMKEQLATTFEGVQFDTNTMKEKQEMDQSVIMNKITISQKGRKQRTKKKIVIDEDEEPEAFVSTLLVKDEDDTHSETEKTNTIIDQSMIMNKIRGTKKERRKRTKKKIVIMDDEEPKTFVSMSLFSGNTVKDEDTKETTMKPTHVVSDDTAVDNTITDDTVLSAIVDPVPITSIPTVGTAADSEEHTFNMDFSVSRSRAGASMIKNDVENENVWDNEHIRSRSAMTWNNVLDSNIWNNMILPTRSRASVRVESQHKQPMDMFKIQENNAITEEDGHLLMVNDEGSDTKDIDGMDEHKETDDVELMYIRSRSGALYTALAEIKDETKSKTPHDLFSMNNSNLLLSLKRVNAHLLMRVISKSLVMIKSLRFIHLCNCGVDDYFLSQIVLQFMQNINDFRIHTLDLQSNNIGDNGLLCLCELMRANNKYLKIIRLQNNKKDISTGVCKQICNALEINDYVIKFGFEFRHYGEKDRTHRALKRNMDYARMQRIEIMNQI